MLVVVNVLVVSLLMSYCFAAACIPSGWLLFLVVSLCEGQAITLSVPDKMLWLLCLQP